MLTEQEECLNAGGSFFIITGTLRHKKTDKLNYLQDKLYASVKKLKNQYGWRQIMKGKSMSTKTVYETTYSLKHGFHPHAHMLIGLNQEGINKTQIHKALNNNWRNYTGANLDVIRVFDASDVCRNSVTKERVARSIANQDVDSRNNASRRLSLCWSAVDRLSSLLPNVKRKTITSVHEDSTLENSGLCREVSPLSSTRRVPSRLLIRH